ncbi:hypothetical protein VTL71DRAFT_5554 [Oculimacula yallundae]|uniref:Uncharacterized protein n=1 Tax=Oculimacula yallundae TaxID=86028 RepID=A0ABR4C1I2_9HELO
MARTNMLLRFFESPTNIPSPPFLQQRTKFDTKQTNSGGSSAAATFSPVLQGIQDISRVRQKRCQIEACTKIAWRNERHIAVKCKKSYLGRKRIGDGNPLINATFVGLRGAFVGPYVPSDEEDEDLIEPFKLSMQEISALVFEMLHRVSTFRKKRDTASTAIILSSRNRFLQRVLRLADLNKDAFCIYSLWLSTREVHVDRLLGYSSFFATLSYVGDDRSISEEWVRMAKLNVLIESYIFGDYIQAPFGFQDLIMSHIIEAYGETFEANNFMIPLDHVRDIWERMYPNTPLRIVMVDMLSSCLSKFTLGEAFKLGMLSVEISCAVDDNLNAHAADGTDPAHPWNTYSSRYFMYSRGIPVSRKHGSVAGAAILPYWDAQGSELSCPEGGW